MSYIQPVFTHAGLTVTAVGVLREESAAQIAYLLDVARAYYKMREVTLNLTHARPTRRAVRQLHRAIEDAQNAGIGVTLHAAPTLQTALTDAAAESRCVDMRAPIGFARRHG